MTISPRARPPAPRPAAVGRPVLGALLLIALLAAFPALALLPNDPGSIRVAGVSVLWWYGGVLAPALGWAIAVWCLPPRSSARDPASAADTSVAPPRGP